QGFRRQLKNSHLPASQSCLRAVTPFCRKRRCDRRRLQWAMLHFCPTHVTNSDLALVPALELCESQALPARGQTAVGSASLAQTAQRRDRERGRCSAW